MLTSALAVAALLAAPRTHAAHDTARAPAACPAPAAAVPAAVATLVAAERGFARMAADSGVQAAFLAVFADDALLFRPAPVPARAFQAAHPFPADGSALEWAPAWAGVSAAGDLGFTGGPFLVRAAPAAGADTGAVVARGTFNSVWRRDAAGRWRLLFDVGGPGATPPNGPTPDPCGPVLEAAPGRARAVRPATGGLAAVLRADTLLGRDAAHQADGLAARGSEARVVRAGVPVRATPAAVRAYAADVAGRLRGAPLGGGVAASGDLAYTYGVYTLAPPAGAEAAERGHYLRVWRPAARGWALLLDVAAPDAGGP